MAGFTESILQVSVDLHPKSDTVRWQGADRHTAGSGGSWEIQSLAGENPDRPHQCESVNSVRMILTQS